MQNYVHDVVMQCKVPEREVQGNIYLKEYYPEINLSNEIHNITSGRIAAFHHESTTSVLQPINETQLKRLFRTYCENGFTEALIAAKSMESKSLIKTLAEYTYRAMEGFNKLKEKMFLKKFSIENIAEFAETRDWNRSYIRSLAWHPHVFKIAVAGLDDIVRIYTDVPTLIPVLKSISQKSITSMAWRPLSTGELAVGCAKGVFIWTMENTHITRAALHEVLLKHPNHCPVTSLAWSKNGVLLATSSIGDSNILVWNVDKGKNTILRRIAPPCTFLKWSPDDTVILSATAQRVFRIWHTQKACSPERWILNSGHIQSAAWSPCGKMILFVSTQDTRLYRLQYLQESVFNGSLYELIESFYLILKYFGLLQLKNCPDYFVMKYSATAASVEKNVTPIADLSKCVVGHREVGGMPQAICWDAQGRFVAVSFKDSSCVAIFSTSLHHHNLDILPFCFITGFASEFPACICFQSCNGSNQDAVLTIGWSSGRLQFFPLSSIS